MAEPESQDLPEQGAVLTFGRSWFAENQSSRFWIKNDKIVACACGDDHTVVLTETHRAFSFGANEFGQLGLGGTKSATRPSCVKALKPEKCVAVGCGKAHTIIGTESGQLFAFGLNRDGQLGLGHTDTTLTPSEVTPWSGRVTQLDGGVAHTVALTEDGRVFAWGNNSEGQCGLGAIESVHQPMAVASEEKVVSVSCGYRHTGWVTVSGRLFTFGDNEHGQLGLEGSKIRETPAWVQQLSGVTRVACGGRHTLALDESGRVFCFGAGADGQLGLGPVVQSSSTPTHLPLEVAAVHTAAGYNHSAVVTGDNRLLTFGDAVYGKLCRPESDEAVFVPTVVDQLDLVLIRDVSLGGCQSMLLVDRLTSPRMLGDLPPLTNGLHDPEPAVTSSVRDNLGEANSTLPPVSRVLPPLRGAPRISPSLSQQEEPQRSARQRARHAGDLQSVSSAADLQQQIIGDERTNDSDTTSSEGAKGCSPLSRLFSRFRKEKPIPREAVTPGTPEEPKEEPDDESRPEGAAQRGLPGGDTPTRQPESPPAVTEASEQDDQQTNNQQSKMCSIL